jgi:hypothetical protein
MQMRVIDFLCLGIGAALLTGCQHARVTDTPPPSAQVCNAWCDVIVTVTLTPKGPQPCDIFVHPDIKVEGRDRTIRWKMDDASADAKFRFEPREGVQLKPNVIDPDHQFSDKEPHGGGKQFHWMDRNTDNQMYEYEINVYQGIPHSVIKCKKDPRIWNS